MLAQQSSSRHIVSNSNRVGQTLLINYQWHWTLPEQSIRVWPTRFEFDTIWRLLLCLGKHKTKEYTPCCDPVKPSWPNSEYIWLWNNTLGQKANQFSIALNITLLPSDNRLMSRSIHRVLADMLTSHLIIVQVTGLKQQSLRMRFDVKYFKQRAEAGQIQCLRLV